MSSQEEPMRSASTGQSEETKETKATTGRARRVPPKSSVTEVRATAQRARLDAQAEARNGQVVETAGPRNASTPWGRRSQLE
ncbi:MAG TPA: hypothetical protein VIY29_29910 [Ktedonobacteraceae bacterium]